MIVFSQSGNRPRTRGAMCTVVVGLREAKTLLLNMMETSGMCCVGDSSYHVLTGKVRGQHKWESKVFFLRRGDWPGGRLDAGAATGRES